jgi:replication factor A1
LKGKKEWRNLRHKRSVGEYLAFLSVKYNVNPDKFLCALRSAEEHQQSKCDNLSIQFRGKIRNALFFLIKSGPVVIAQFPVDNDFLLNKSSYIGNFMKTDRIRRYLLKKTRIATSNSIRDVRAGMSHINVKARILEVAETKHVVTRYGNHASVTKALIADETGTIKLCLWNGQIDSVSVGDTVQIENAQASMFKGERQLSLGKKGTLSSVEEFKPELKSMELPAAKA